MTTQEVKRKLAAILSADVKGYSRLMGEDEEGTIRILNAYKDVMTSLIEHHHGRVVDAPADNMLVEFSSVVDALRCAAEIQKELKTRNGDLPENRRMEFRMGVNLGDVIEDGEQILGDGVNIAARLESLSEAGGICISRTAFDQVRNKLDLGYEYLGEQTVKNIAVPVRVYRVLMEPEAAGKVIGEKKAKPRQRQRSALYFVIALILVVAAIAIWRFYLHPTPPIEVASKEKMAFPLPDKPSIAVLPFVNMSGDPKQEYFSDGLTEQIITSLSKFPRLFVIARNSTFVYKGRPVKIQKVAEDLGVRYVLEGSLQKSGDRLRITAQLIDASTGGLVWSERYDRNLKDIFALQDEITMEILTAVRVKLTDGEQARLYGKGAKNLDSYLKVLQGVPYFYRFNRENNIQARQMFEEAIALDPENAIAYTNLAWTHMMEVWFGLSESTGKSMERALELAQKALVLDDTLDLPHSLLGNIYLLKRKYEKAIAEAERAVALNPNGADAHAHLGMILNYAGRREEAIRFLEKAIRLNPFPPNWYLFSLGEAYHMSGQYEKAIAAYESVIHRYPDDIRAHIGAAAANGLWGREGEARDQAAQILRIEPTFSVESFVKTLPFKNRNDIELFSDALRRAGLK